MREWIAPPFLEVTEVNYFTQATKYFRTWFLNSKVEIISHIDQRTHEGIKGLSDFPMARTAGSVLSLKYLHPLSLPKGATWPQRSWGRLCLSPPWGVAPPSWISAQRRLVWRQSRWFLLLQMGRHSEALHCSLPMPGTPPFIPLGWALSSLEFF